MLKTETVENISRNSREMLKIKNFGIVFDTAEGQLTALEEINLSVFEHQTLGIIGESGSGKTTLATAIMGLIPENARVSGSIDFNDKVLINEDEFGKGYRKLKKKTRKMLDLKLQEIRWRDISMIFQGSMNAFNPAYTIEKQIGEVFRIHTNLDDKQIHKKCIETIEFAGLNPQVLSAFPHELSGGMKQRAVIAMALALSPKLVIADEPTTGLDVITQAKIISELKKLKQTALNSMIVISHDVGVVSQLADTVMVLYAGKIMEIGPTWEVYGKSLNPYTMALLNSYPSIEAAKMYISGIPGSLPDPLSSKTGCYFAPRCKFADQVCFSEIPKLREVSSGRFSRCHYAEKFLNKDTYKEEKKEATHSSDYNSRAEPVLKIEELTEYFSMRGKAYGELYGKEGVKRVVKAVDHVSAEIKRGEIFGVVGESGSGKTTLGRVILRLLPPTSGKIYYMMKKNTGNDGDVKELVEIEKFKDRDHEIRKFRSETQLIFQDPYDSIDPKMTVYNIIQEPIIAHKVTNDPLRISKMVNETLVSVNLSPPENYIERYPHELSGGERQRVAAARALVLRPELLVADEPISMLDVSLRAGFMNLLINMRNKFGISILYITHDLASARYLCDKLLVMYLGVGMEGGFTEDVIKTPLHPYTKALIKAVPKPSKSWDPSKIDIIGEVGNAIDVPAGCRFTKRCPYAVEKCMVSAPPRREEGNGHWYLCHFNQDELESYKSFHKEKFNFNDEMI